MAKSKKDVSKTVDALGRVRQLKTKLEEFGGRGMSAEEVSEMQDLIEQLADELDKLDAV